ncbi:MAG: tRNA 2-thiocytidine(32) synthetase TtcA [Candidatus Omnitrophica bacterium]|nr:tRNA 2-thiocytidine(32) synthetase TtcA [Candidatus Omnitrophota bacterium]
MKISSIEYLINRRTGKALHDYKMISDGDRILVGVSGQDSLSLLNLLKMRLEYVPVKYKLIAAHVAINKKNAKVIGNYLEKQGIEYYILKQDLKNSKKGIKKTKCFFCSWKRREAIFKLASRLRCKKIAFGHHLDDILETLLLNILFQAQISTMPPKLKMFKGRFHIIRPFSYLGKTHIEMYARLKKIPKLPYECPYGNITNRALVRDVIKDLSKKIPHLKENIFKSMSDIRKVYLPIKGIK